MTKSGSPAPAVTDQKKKNTEKKNTPLKVKKGGETKTPRKNHTPSPAKGVSGDGICGSSNGKTTTCHQCRHNRVDSIAVWCTDPMGSSRCSSMYCHRCLLNRYDEKAEEIVASGKWSCPKCRNICNCSVCMKRKGLEPVGILTDKKNTAGVTCVSDTKKKCSLEVKKDTKISPVSDMKKKTPSKVKKSPLKVKNDAEISPVSDMKKKTPSKVKKSPLKVKKATDISSVSDIEKKSLVKVKEATETELPRKNLTPLKKHVSASQVYHSGSGATLNCHQCQHKQQKEDSLSVWCTNQKGDKRCSSMYCDRCLLNRYGEEAKEVVAVGNWSCPRCRGICNCSVCMKRSGNVPTGILIHKAKAAGFSSVSDMLVNTGKVVSGTPTKKRKVVSDTPIKKRKVVSDTPTKRKKVVSDTPTKRKKVGPDVVISLEKELTRVVGIAIPSEDVGKALQFLEFCAVFGKILDFKKGEPEYILQDLTESRGKFSATVQFHIYLLRIIQKERGEESAGQSSSNVKFKSSWFEMLKKCLAQSQGVLEAQRLAFLDNTADYETLDTSKRLILLNLLCDEILGTRKVRVWLDQNARVAAKDMDKSRKQTSDHGIDDAILPRDTLRTEPVFVERSGYAFWKLNALGKSDMLCQNVGKIDTLTLDEKWSSVDAAGEEAIEKLISFKGDRKLGVSRILHHQDKTD